jgi:hypothetical protein
MTQAQIEKLQKNCLHHFHGGYMYRALEAWESLRKLGGNVPSKIAKKLKAYRHDLNSHSSYQVGPLPNIHYNH